jgi:NADPH:quinone reductase-like Zn-dependent oxidoreductase
MNDNPKAKRAGKQWRRILKWTVGTLFVALILWGLIAYWTSTNDCQRYAAAPTDAMKAIAYCDYGVANLKVVTVEKPAPADDQVLVRVRATSVNPYDWHFVEGTPKVMRLGVGLRKPKDTRLGVDYAGTVEAVGKSVTRFKPGDEVFGGKTGAFAEYVCVREDRLIATKPTNVTFEEAGSVDIAGVTALQAVRDKGKVQPGQRILINGASGGVGTFAVQIGKSLGANVTGVCSTRNVDLVRSLGADRVIDYTKEDFTKGTDRYDVIIDNIANHSLSEVRHVLTPKGKYIIIGGGSGAKDWQGLFGMMTRMFKTLFVKPFVSQEMGMMLTDPTQNDLVALADLMQSGKVKPVLDRTYKSLSAIPEAIRYVEQGHARGKVVVTME